MPGLAKTAIPAALGGGALLFGDDAEAGILRKGATEAREHIGWRAIPSGEIAGEFLTLGKDQRVIDRKLDLLVDVMMPNGQEGKRGYKTFQDFIHQKSNYDDWSKVVEIDDKSLRGAHYKDGLDAFLEYVVEKKPQLKPYVERYAKERLFGDHNTVMAKKPPGSIYRPRDDKDRKVFVHRATKSPGLLDPGFEFRSTPGKGPETHVNRGNGVSKFGRKKAGKASLGVGAPTLGQDYLEATMHNREQKLNEHMDNLGLTKDPMYEYGSLLPIKQNIVTGESSLAAPEVLRDVMRGILGLGMTPETGIYDPQNLLDTVL
jgi:hypothetical protein